jgi:hypothetical protein
LPLKWSSTPGILLVLLWTFPEKRTCGIPLLKLSDTLKISAEVLSLLVEIGTCCVVDKEKGVGVAPKSDLDSEIVFLDDGALELVLESDIFLRWW